jgi:hypothetical protein
VQVHLLSACRVAATVLCLPGSAFAQAPRQVRFAYELQEGASSCPDLATVQAGVAARLGYEPFNDSAEDLVRATIHPFGHGLEARIEMTNAGGSRKAERKLVSHQRDCAELASSVELAVSIAIDPLRLAPTPPGPGSREQAPAASVAGLGEEPTQPRPAAVLSAGEPGTTSTPGRPILGRVEAGLVGTVGSAPSPSLGVAAGVGIRGGDFSLGIEGRADISASTSLRVGEASTSLLVASLVPCLHFGKLAGCALATAGALRAAGHGLIDSRQVTVPYVALGARLAIALPITKRLSLAMHGDMTTPIGKTHLEVDDSEVWTTPPLAFVLGLGVAASFP